MPKIGKVVWRHVGEISPIATSHGVGERRVIVSQAEIGRPVTQISRTILRYNEKVEKHVHPTMDEHFFFLDGECIVNVGECKYLCKGGDYLYVPANYNHEIKVNEETIMITVGIEHENK